MQMRYQAALRPEGAKYTRAPATRPLRPAGTHVAAVALTPTGWLTRAEKKFAYWVVLLVPCFVMISKSLV